MTVFRGKSTYYPTNFQKLAGPTAGEFARPRSGSFTGGPL